ncbi:hypothetical protein D3C85_1461270 [compost metagenome]
MRQPTQAINEAALRNDICGALVLENVPSLAVQQPEERHTQRPNIALDAGTPTLPDLPCNVVCVARS